MCRGFGSGSPGGNITGCRYLTRSGQGAFPNEDAVRKAFYLRIVEIYKKWNGRPVANWAMVRNQLAMDEKMQARILKYEQYWFWRTKPAAIKTAGKGKYKNLHILLDKSHILLDKPQTTSKDMICRIRDYFLILPLSMDLLHAPHNVSLPDSL